MNELSFAMFCMLLDIQTRHWRARYAVERWHEEWIDFGGES